MSGSAPRSPEFASTRPSSVPRDTDAEALRRLRHSGYSALRDVSCEAHGEGVRLRDPVRSHYLKQMAQAIVAEIEGMRRVVNLIKGAAPASGPNAVTVRACQIEVAIDIENKPRS